MRRRDFIAGFGGTLISPLSARAQTKRVVAIQMGTSSHDAEQASLVRTLVEELSRFGWNDGANIRIVYNWAEGDPSRLKQQAAETAKLGPDVVFAQGTPVTLALIAATRTVPTVFVNVSDPTGTGIVESFARPGRNATGFTNYEPSMGGKWLETLREIAPQMSRVLIVFNSGNPAGSSQAKSVEDEANGTGLKATAAPARTRADIERNIEAFAPGSGGGLLIMPDFLTTAHRDLIIERAAHYKCPAIFPFRLFVTSGGLVAYSVDENYTFRQAAGYVNRILRGARPTELPVQAPTKFELSINLRTAKALNLFVSPALLARANEVIE